MALLVFFVLPIWACSLATFISIIALAYMLNDYLEERRLKQNLPEGGKRPIGVHESVKDNYPEWRQRTEEPEVISGEAELDRPRTRKKVVIKYMNLFNLDEIRAGNIFDAGYQDVSMLIEAELSDLIKIKGINPTIARRILIISRSS